MRRHAIDIIIKKISGKNLGYENRNDLVMFQQISHVQNMLYVSWVSIRNILQREE